jgi:hypothetical protein
MRGKRIIRWKLVLILFFIFLYACQKDINWFEIGPEEYKIYKTIIDEFYMESDCSLIVIECNLMTTPERMKINIGTWYAEDDLFMDTYMRIDFSSKSGEMRHLKNKFPLETDYVLINDKEINSLSHSMNQNHMVIWEQFYKKFPKSLGFIAFSPVGFNKEKNLALVYFEIRRNRLDAFGDVVLLEKRKALMNTWHVRKIISRWFS